MAVELDVFERAALDTLSPAKGAESFFRNPVGFVRECIRWSEVRDSDGPADYQERALEALVESTRLALRGPHGLGKTALDAWVVLWFSLSSDAEGVDWKAPTTASTWRQLTKYLWPEIKKWSRYLDWESLGRKPFVAQVEMMKLELRLAHGAAFAVASKDPAMIEGVHADRVLYLFDESKTIPGETFDAAEGAFSGAGADTGREAFAFATSTPGAPVGRFFEIHDQQKGLEDWRAMHVTLEDTVRAKRNSMEWARQRARQWGENTAVYLNRVLGEFCAEDEDGIILSAWVEEAFERWRDVAVDDRVPAEVAGPITCVAVDVARSGRDKTVIAIRRGDIVTELREHDYGSTMETTGATAAILRTEERPPRAVVDGIGLGAGVVDRLREQGLPVESFVANRTSTWKDRTGELMMADWRTAAIWHLRDLLDPDTAAQIALPPNDELLGDLTAPRWTLTSGGKVKAETKEEIKKRIGRSTDRGDAVCMAFWLSLASPSASAPVILRRPGGSRLAPVRQRAGAI